MIIVLEKKMLEIHEMKYKGISSELGEEMKEFK